MKKYDERETLFSRVALKKGTKEYKDFYQKNKNLKTQDDAQRGIAFRNNLKKDKRFKELFFPLISDNKRLIKQLFDMVESKPVNSRRVAVDSSVSANLKEIAKYYGATDVGIVKLTDYSYYDKLGGLSEAVNLHTYNEKIYPKYKTAIVYTMLMDKEKINRAPNYEELLATEHAYVEVAFTGSRIAMYLKELGYNAMFNNSEYYLAPLVPLAHDAGLGQIGMCNHIVPKFCNRFSLCLSKCPTKAITHLPRVVNGRQFYKFDENRCFDMWIKSGTDCGTCRSTCPFTQGLDLSKIEKIKEEPELIDEIINEFKEKYGRRVYQKEELDIVKVKKDEK